jgi:hypothetical protein
MIPIELLGCEGHIFEVDQCRILPAAGSLRVSSDLLAILCGEWHLGGGGKEGEVLSAAGSLRVGMNP